MVYYNRIDLSEGINIAKSNINKECIICYYWFLDQRFKFQDSACNGCHDFTMLNDNDLTMLNISDIPIIAIKNVDYSCIIHNISKSEAINLFEKNLFLKIKFTILVYYYKYILNDS